MNAKEANKIAALVPDISNTQIIRELDIEIENAAKAGSFSLLRAIPTSCYNECIQWLTDQGYKVEYAGIDPPSTSNKSQLCWISWE